MRRPVDAETGWVEVADEPLHKEVLSDKHFRIYRVSLSPGQATQFHRHSEDTIYVVTKGGRMSTRTLKGFKPSPMVFARSFPFCRKLWLGLQVVFTGSAWLPDGLAFFMPSRSHPSVHRAAASRRNRSAVCLIGIEMLALGR